MQGIYNYIPETNYIPREYSVAAILLLPFMVLISLVSVLNVLYFYISTFRSMCAVPNMAVFSSSLTSYFPGMLLTYFLNDFQIVPVAPIITGITFVFTFHLRCISIVEALYFRIFSASFLITFLSPKIATFINIHVTCIIIFIIIIIANYMKLNVNKTRAISFRNKTHWHGYVYKLCQSSIARAGCIWNLGVLTDTKLHFHQQVDNIFFQAIRQLGIIRPVTFSFPSLMLYCTLIRPELKCVSVASNTIIYSGA